MRHIASTHKGGMLYYNTQRNEFMHPEDNLSNVVIRILNSIAKDINYYSTLDMNCLTMHI